MPWDGSGRFTLNQDFPLDRDLGTPDSLIQADKVDDELKNIKAGLENCFTLTGETVPVANIPMGGYRFTGMSAATQPDEAIIASQVSSGELDWIGAFGGTATALTAALTFAQAPFQSGLRIRGKALSDSADGTTTLSLNSVAPVQIKHLSGNPIRKGDWVADQMLEMTFDGTIWRLTGTTASEGRGVATFRIDGYTSVVNNAYTCTISDKSWPGLATGQQFILTAQSNNTNACTLNITFTGGSTGAKPIVKYDNTALAANQLQSGGRYLLSYDGTSFVILGPYSSTPVLPGTINLDDVTDVDTAGIQVGQGIVRNSSNTGYAAGNLKAKFVDFTDVADAPGLAELIAVTEFSGSDADVTNGSDVTGSTVRDALNALHKRVPEANATPAFSSSMTLDLATGLIHTITLTGALDLDVTNAPIGGCVVIRLIQGGSGSYGVTLSSKFKNANGVAPTLSTAVGKVDILTGVIVSSTRIEMAPIMRDMS